MADTTEMLRIIRHAADRLAEEDPPPMFSERIGEMTYDGPRAKAVEALMSLRMAMGYAESVLRMVAACMDDEPAKAPPAPTERAEPIEAGAFDPLALYAELERQRAAADISWRQLADEADVSPSTLTRIGQGKRPDADSLVALLGWLGTTDLAPFLAVSGG